MYTYHPLILSDKYKLYYLISWIYQSFLFGSMGTGTLDEYNCEIKRNPYFDEELSSRNLVKTPLSQKQEQIPMAEKDKHKPVEEENEQKPVEEGENQRQVMENSV